MIEYQLQNKLQNSILIFSSLTKIFSMLTIFSCFLLHQALLSLVDAFVYTLNIYTTSVFFILTCACKVFGKLIQFESNLFYVGLSKASFDAIISNLREIYSNYFEAHLINYLPIMMSYVSMVKDVYLQLCMILFIYGIVVVISKLLHFIVRWVYKAMYVLYVYPLYIAPIQVLEDFYETLKMYV
jgi:hypothetical protein